MDLEYKSCDFDNSIRKDIDDTKDIQIMSSEYFEFQQELFDFHSLCLNPDKISNNEIIKQSTNKLNQLKIFLQQKFNINNLHDSLRFIFELPIKIIENNYNYNYNYTEHEKEYYEEHQNQDIDGIEFLDLQNFILSFVDFIYEFTKTSSDQECFLLAETKYINSLKLIWNNIHFSPILLATANCFINLLDHKPLTGKYIPYQIYLYAYKTYYLLTYSPEIQIYFDPNIEKDQQIFLLRSAIIEACLNLEIFLPDHYKKVVEDDADAIPYQLYSIITLFAKSSLREDNKYSRSEATFFFKLIEKVFEYADSSIKSVYMNFEFIKLLINFLGEDFNFIFDLQILFCLSKVAEKSATNATSIITPDFVRYKPYKEGEYYDKKLIISYCNLWITVISSLTKPTMFAMSSKRSVESLQKNADNIIEIMSIILNQQANDYDFEMMKSTTLIHVALINSKDNEIISKILTNLTDVTDRIQQLIDEADPKSVTPILNAIDTLIDFKNSHGDSFHDLSEWLKNDGLLTALEGVGQTFDEEGFPCNEIQNVIEKLKSIIK